MELPLHISPERLLLLLGLSFFFGLAFEEFYGTSAVKPPGGVRTFPLLAFSGAGLYILEPSRALPFTAGLLAVGAWLLLYYRLRIQHDDGAEPRSAELIVPVSNLVAYLLGPLVLGAPIWVGIGFTVAAVLLLGAREPLHALARRVPPAELSTLGKFLILTGIILPLLPKQPVTELTTITPYQVWLAVIAVSTLSYASYLVQRYLAPTQGGLVAALLGGLYSSTATTVVLARRLRAGAPGEIHAGTRHVAQIQAGIVLATAVMYLRIAVVVAVFNLALAKALLPALLVLALLAGGIAALHYWREPGRSASTGAEPAPDNPLELSAALLFAALFVVISLASAWAQNAFGRQGLYALAAILGVSDIDPFVLSIAQGSVQDAPMTVMMAAILIAASSNNLLKALYAVVFGRARAGALPAGVLVALGLAGFGVVFWLVERAA